MIGSEITENKFFIVWRMMWTIISPAFIIVKLASTEASRFLTNISI